jgi:hypothetical protein
MVTETVGSLLFCWDPRRLKPKAANETTSDESPVSIITYIGHGMGQSLERSPPRVDSFRPGEKRYTAEIIISNAEETDNPASQRLTRLNRVGSFKIQSKMPYKEAMTFLL